MRRKVGKTRFVTSTADVFSASAGRWGGMEARLWEAQGDSVKLRCAGSAPGQTTGSVSQVYGRTTSAASAAASEFVAMLHSESASGWHPPGSVSLTGVKPREAFTVCFLWDKRGVPHREFGACTGVSLGREGAWKRWEGEAWTGVNARVRRVTRGERQQGEAWGRTALRRLDLLREPTGTDDNVLELWLQLDQIWKRGTQSARK